MSSRKTNRFAKGCVLLALCAVLAISPPVQAGIGKIVAVINQAHGASLSGAAPTTGQVMAFNGTQWAPAAGSPLVTGDLAEVTGIGATTTTGISATGANDFGANGVTTTFTGTTNVTILDGVVGLATLNASSVIHLGDADEFRLGFSNDAYLIWSLVQASANNLIFAVDATGDANAGGAVILTHEDNRAKDHHLATSLEVAHYLFSGTTDVDSDATKWGSLSHNATNFVFGLGSGGYDFSGGQILASDGTGSAPGYSWASDPNSGILNSGSGVIDFITDTSLPFRITATQVVLGGSVDLLMQTDATLTMGTGQIIVSDDASVVYGTGADVFAQGESTTLADGAGTASTVLSVVMGDGDNAGVVITYFADFSDGTENQSEAGTVTIALVDDAGGIAPSTPGEVSAQSVSSGTLTTTWTVVTTDDQPIEIQLAATSSLTTTTHVVRWKAVASGNVTLVVP